MKASELRERLDNGLIVYKQNLIGKIAKQEEYIGTLKAEINATRTELYNTKMAAQEVNTRKNKLIAEQQAEIEHLMQLFGCDPAYFEPDKNPVKALTDSEIMEVITMSHSWIDGYPKKYALEFARAILRKAQEK